MYQEATLKLKTRPLRLVYLVGSLTDLADAVKLYTHMWGGFSNVILPVPDDTEDTKSLKLALQTLNPDYIFLPSESLAEDINNFLEYFPSRCLKLLSEKIEAICNLDTSISFLPIQAILNLNTREFPHIIKVANSIDRGSSINKFFGLVSEQSLFSSETFWQFGITSREYRDYLTHQPDCRLLSINSVESLLKMSLLVLFKRLISPIAVTKTAINYAEDSANWIFENSTDTINLFLYKPGDFHLATAFWNSCRLDIGYSNKLILPKESFIKSLKQCLQLLLTALPSLNHLHLYVDICREEAEVLANDIHNMFNSLEREVAVSISYRKLAFSLYFGRVYSSKPIITTRGISSLDRAIRFEPLIPPYYEDSNSAFGYDAEISFPDGNSFSIPFSQSSSVLLSNPIGHIRSAENNLKLYNEAPKRNKTQPVRPSFKGVTGIAVPNEECRIYIPESEEIIDRWFKEFSFSFKPNDHTRYALGFIKRFGGLDKTRDLISSGGTKIFTALDCDRASACGFKRSQVISYLTEQLKLTKTDAKKTVDQNLPELLKAGLVYRGYPLKCPTCGLQDWYKLDKVDEFVRCSGCLEDFQLESLSSIEFAYKPNELASRFLKTDGQAILSTYTSLSWLASYGHIQLGGDLIKWGEKQSFAEIDLVLLIQNYLILVECKSCHFIDESKANEIIEHLERVVQTATLVSAKVVILGIVTVSDCNDLFCRVSDIARDAAQKGIGVHLLINENFYLLGQQENRVMNLWSLRIEELLAYEDTLDNNLDDSIVRVGAVAIKKMIGINNIEVDWNLLEIWEEELCS